MEIPSLRPKQSVTGSFNSSSEGKAVAAPLQDFPLLLVTFHPTISDEMDVRKAERSLVIKIGGPNQKHETFRPYICVAFGELAA